MPDYSSDALVHNAQVPSSAVLCLPPTMQAPGSETVYINPGCTLIKQPTAEGAPPIYIILPPNAELPPLGNGSTGHKVLGEEMCGEMIAHHASQLNIACIKSRLQHAMHTCHSSMPLCLVFTAAQKCGLHTLHYLRAHSRLQSPVHIMKDSGQC